MDALTLKAQVFELKNTLNQARIEKIYQPSGFELILKTSKGSLLLSTHPTHFSAHISTLKFDNPASPTAFAMLLRKHIAKGHINDVSMEGYERIITISIDNTNELFNAVSFKLIIELMGKHSNIILTDEQGKILDSIKRIPMSVSRVRQVLPGLEYMRPPRKDDIPDNITENYQSFTGINYFTKEKLNSGVISINECIESITSPTPNIVYVNDKPKLPLSILIPDTKAKIFNTMSEMLDYFYSLKDSSIQNTDVIRSVNTIIQRLRRSMDVHNKSLNTDEEKYRLYGELITSSAHNIKQGQSSAKVLNYYSNEEIEIQLDQNLSPHENAQKYYKRYSKIKAAKSHAKEQLNIITEQLDYLENIIVFLKNASSGKDVDAIKQELRDNGFMKKSKSKTKQLKLEPVQYKSSDGFSIKVGRNSLQNDELTTKKAKTDDMWCHVKDIPGSHVIIQRENGNISDTAILEACQIAAYHSKAKTSSNVPVDYTLIKHVKKPAHAMPGKVIYTNQKTLFVTPDPQEISKLMK